MADRPGPVIPGGAGSAKRQVSGRALLLWLGGAVVVAAAAFAVIRFIDFDGGAAQAPAREVALPPDPEPPPATTTTSAPTTTTAPPVLEVLDSDPLPADADVDDASTAPEADQAAEADADAVQREAAMPPFAASWLTIRDAGDFAGQVTLPCRAFAVHLTWRVLPPYELPEDADEDGVLQRQRERTLEPLGSEGFVQVHIETFVPAGIDNVAAATPPSAGAVEGAGDEPSADDESAGADPDEAPPDDAVEGATAEEDAAPVAESVLVLDASNISGRHTDSGASGEMTGVMHHGCPASESDGFAEWKVTVEGHAEVAWELGFELIPDDADGSDGDPAEAAGTDGSNTSVDAAAGLASQLLDEAGPTSGEQ